MAYAFDPTLDFDAQEQQMLQQAARIKALRETQAKGVKDGELQPGYDSALVPGFKYTGRQLKTSALAAAVPLLADMTATGMEKDQVQQRNDISNLAQDKFQEWWGARPKETPGTPETLIPPLTPNDDEGNAMPNAIRAGTPAVPVTQGQIDAHVAAGAKAGPLVKAFLNDYAKSELIDRPKAADAAAATARQGYLNRQNTLAAAAIRANGGGSSKFTVERNEDGSIAGSFDEKKNIFHYTNGDKLDLNTGAYIKANGQAVAAAPGGAAASATPGATTQPVSATPGATTPASNLPIASGRIVHTQIGPVDASVIPGYTPIASNKGVSPSLIDTNKKALEGFNNSHRALNLISEMKAMTLKGDMATTETEGVISDVKNEVGTLAGTYAPKLGVKGGTDPKVDRFRAYKTKAGQLNTLADKGMFGPQYSVFDVEQMQETMGRLNAATSNEARMEILDELERDFRRRLNPRAAPAAAAPAAAAPAAAAPAAAPAARPKEKFEPPPPQAGEGQAMLQEWRDAPNDNSKALIEQRMMSRGVVINGRPYLGGDPTKKESWGPRK